MSRSIHTTRQSYAKLLAKKFPNEEVREDALKTAYGELRKKRQIKRTIKSERTRPEPPLVATAAEAIPIEIKERGPYIHHAASEEDIRAVLSLLPLAATEGIARIVLCLGKDYILESRYAGGEEPYEVDPFTGRPSSEIFPGVYAGEVLGSYLFYTARIAINAFVYDAEKLPFSRSSCELILRLNALSTLLHEVGHHHDHIHREKRGRWRCDRKKTVEQYAEQREHDWTQKYLLPYLKSRYAAECKELLDWVEHHGGLRLTLDFFADDPRQTNRVGEERFRIFSNTGEFCSWVEKFPECESLAESRLAFAQQIHYLDRYQDCLSILEQVLAEEPENVAALALKADTLVHLERYDEAYELVQQVLRNEPENSEAWRTRCDVLAARKEWLALLESCEQWESFCTDRMDQRTRRVFLATAYLSLGNEKAFQALYQQHLSLPEASEEMKTRRRFYFLQQVYRRLEKEMPEAEWMAMMNLRNEPVTRQSLNALRKKVTLPP